MGMILVVQGGFIPTKIKAKNEEYANDIGRQPSSGTTSTNFDSFKVHGTYAKTKSL